MYRFEPDRLPITHRGSIAAGKSAWRQVRWHHHALLALALVFGAGQARAASYVVDTVTDDGGLAACTAAADDCSLRGAIADANAAGGSNTIGFDGTVFSTQQRIYLGSDLPAITGALVVNGPGTSLLLVDGTTYYRPFTVGSGADLTLDGLTIVSATGDNGGGIYNNGGTLTVTHSALYDSDPTTTGGAIYSDGTLSVSDSYFEQNTGAIYVQAGSATVSDSTFYLNSLPTCGGAITLAGGSLTVSGTLFNSNLGLAGGGAICNTSTSGSLTVINSTFLKNTAQAQGGALFTASGTTSTVTNSTFSGNRLSTASGIGGIDNNGALNLNNSLLANSNGDDCGNTGTITVRYSLIRDGSCGISNGVNGNLTGDPMFTGLADNGGPTQTIAPKAGSPAVNAGSNALAVDENSNPLTTDQRGSGYARIYAGTVDMGAVELVYPISLVVDTTSDADLETCSAAANDCSLRGAITLANGMANPAAISFDATVFASAQTITLSSSLPAITNTYGLSISGTGPSLLSVDGAGSYRPFAVNSGAVATLQNLTIANGYANHGGGVTSNGALTIRNAAFVDNTGINVYGGAIYLGNGSATVTASTFTGNKATGDGGAIDNYGATLTVINSTFTGNTTTHPSAGYGGAIYNTSGATTTVINSTLDGNGAIYGGNIYSQGSFTLHNSIVADNTSGGDCQKAAGSFDVQYSLIKDSSCGITAGANGNLTGAPLLGALADNGGPTQTMALQAGSPAINAGSNPLAVDENSNPLGTDQRGAGYARVEIGTVDMGAFEYIDSAAPTVTGFAANSPSNSLDIPITSFTASDNIGVTGYLITESATPPSAGAAGWTASAPTTYTVAGDGNYTLYPWAKDASGNVSAVYGSPASVTVDSTAPTVTGFAATSPTNSLAIPITTFTATDTNGVTGYLITESSTPPSAGAAGWSGTAPSTYSVSGDGSYTLYPWAKDALGNVSAVYGSPASVVVDTTPPSVTIASTAFNPTGTSQIPISITFSEPVNGFTQSDISVSNGTPSNFAGSGAAYTVDVTPTADGTVTVGVAANVATDAAGNGNTAAVTFSIVYQSGLQDGPDFIVNNPADTDDGECDLAGQGSGNQDCTLREAISAANAHTDASTITFAADYTITLASSELPSITTQVTIIGTGEANTVIEASVCDPVMIQPSCPPASWGVFYVDTPSNLTLQDLTVRNGNAAMYGGAVNNYGTLTLSNVALKHNAAGTHGGAVSNAGTATLMDVTLNVNHSSNGGGFYNTLAAQANMNGATFANNIASGNGAGMYLGSGSGSTFLENITLSANSAGSAGGGIYVSSSNPFLDNLTLSGNSAPAGMGGGLFITGQAGNTSTIALINTIIANSVSGGDCVNDAYGTIGFEGYNLIQDAASACSLSGAADIVGADPLLGTLADNGGSTKTFALLPGSPAIDKGNNGGCPSTDQRGVARPQGPTCDIGAYELLDEIFKDGFEASP